MGGWGADGGGGRPKQTVGCAISEAEWRRKRRRKRTVGFTHHLTEAERVLNQQDQSQEPEHKFYCDNGRLSGDFEPTACG